MRFTVTELTRQIKTLIEGQFYNVELVGEISSFTRHPSGHIYFSLKDRNSYIKAVIWSQTARRLREHFNIGDKVTIIGKISLYEKKGEYHIVTSSIKKNDGKGELYLKFEALKKRLEAEGLFEKEKKKLPKFPKRVAVLTAKNGAALTDFLNVAERRDPNLNVIIIPTIVQGRDAANNISFNIKMASKSKNVDLIVLTRGGGSIEDLWAFNEEVVARAIYESNKPILSAIGHERDFTIADFVADRRAATPSEAAEIVFPEINDISNKLKMLESKINHIYLNLILNKENKLYRYKKEIEKILPHLIKDEQFRLQNLSNRLNNSINFKTAEYWNELNMLKNKLSENEPQQKISNHKNLINLQKMKLKNQIDKIIKDYQDKLNIYETKLENLSPNKVLEKGYSLIIDKNNIPVTSSNRLNSGEDITIKFKDGSNFAIIK